MRARGIRIEEGARVTRIDFETAGVAVTTESGAFNARAIVGADGVGSIVRRALALPKSRLLAQVIELDTEPVDSDRDRDIIHFDLADRDFTGYAWDFPTVVEVVTSSAAACTTSNGTTRNTTFTRCSPSASASAVFPSTATD